MTLRGRGWRSRGDAVAAAVCDHCRCCCSLSNLVLLDEARAAGTEAVCNLCPAHCTLPALGVTQDARELRRYSAPIVVLQMTEELSKLPARFTGRYPFLLLPPH